MEGSMSMESSDLARALCDVRRAYRLLQAYHRRLCDLLQTTDETLARQGLTFSHWEPINVARLPKRKSPFFRPTTWAWDFTPIYQVRCSWEKAEKGRSRCVVIEAVADTGFNAGEDGEPDPSRFNDVEKCATELWIALYTARTDKPDWGAAWNKIEQLPDYYDGRAHTVKVGGAEHTYQYRTVNLAELVDEGAVKAKLLAFLEAWLKETRP
jgi:hypothetical protein